MIELNKKTQQDFLNREWVQRLLEAGVDMSDAKYKICRDYKTEIDYIFLGTPISNSEHTWVWIIPTYTVSELLYKLHEWIYPTIDGEEFSGGLKGNFIKDAPFYIFWYDLKKEYKDEHGNVERVVNKPEYIYAEFEYPIESLASLLVQCHKKDIGIARKDTGNISDK